MSGINSIGAEFTRSAFVSKYKAPVVKVGVYIPSGITKFQPPVAGNAGITPLPEHLEVPRTGKESDRINYIVAMFSRHSQRA